jgi:hypothetical protein
MRPPVCPALFAATLLFTTPGIATAQVQIIGQTVAFQTDHFLARFRGPDLSLLLNRRTQEQYVQSATFKSSTLDMGMVNETNIPLHEIAPGWRQGRLDPEKESARNSWTDGTRTIHMRVDIDRKTQDILVILTGSASVNGVTGLSWGMRGLDLTAGRLIIPAFGGCALDDKSMPESLTLGYPSQWEANCVIWEGKQGGFVVYSRDNQGYFKKLHIKRRGSYADIVFETEAAAPWPNQGEVPDMMWRINCFQGDWSVAAGGYKGLMNFLRPPVPLATGRLWAASVRTVKTVGTEKLDPEELATLAKASDPTKTLLRIANWRKSPPGENYPDYEMNEAAREYIRKAHELGFRVMLPMHLMACTSTNEQYQRFKKLQMRDPRNMEPIGNLWNERSTNAKRFAFISLASPGWRTFLVDTVLELVKDLQIDAIEFEGIRDVGNDGNGSVNKKSALDGYLKLHEQLLTAAPSLVTGADAITEWTHPVTWFGKPVAKSPYPFHPISLFLFGEHVIPTP